MNEGRKEGRNKATRFDKISFCAESSCSHNDTWERIQAFKKTPFNKPLLLPLSEFKQALLNEAPRTMMAQVIKN